MLKYLKHLEIDKAKWDICMQASLNAKIYGLSSYLDAVCDSWDGIIVGDYEAVFPIPIRKKWGFKFCIQPPFCQQLGLFYREDIHVLLIPEILKLLSKKFLLIHLHLNNKNNSIGIKRNNFIVNLNKTYLEINKNYNSTTKRNLKKLEGMDLKIETIGVSEIIDLYLKEINFKTPGFIEKNGDKLLKLVYENRGSFNIISNGIKIDGKLAGGYLILEFLGRFYFLFSATSLNGKEMRLMYCLIDTFIKQNSEKNSILDFEGSEISSLAQFYKGFGSMNEPYFKYKKSIIPFI